jgi:hypothetical protein
MAFTDELIRAAVHTGQFSDPAAERHLATVLMKRRDAVGRAYLTAINPVVDPQLDAAGTLTLKNAAVAAGFAQAPAGYRASWLRFDNATGETRPIGDTRSTTTSVAPPAGLLPAASGSFIEIDIAAEGASQASWQQPVRTFFRRTSDGWKLVGLERLPDGKATAPAPQPASKDGRS